MSPLRRYRLRRTAFWVLVCTPALVLIVAHIVTGTPLDLR